MTPPSGSYPRRLELDDGRLAAAVRDEQRVNGAGADFKIHALHDLAARKDFGQPPVWAAITASAMLGRSCSSTDTDVSLVAVVGDPITLSGRFVLSRTFMGTFSPCGSNSFCLLR